MDTKKLIYAHAGYRHEENVTTSLFDYIDYLRKKLKAVADNNFKLLGLPDGKELEGIG